MRPAVQQQLLQRIDVLVLVNHEVAVTVPDGRGSNLVLREDGGRQLEHGLEIHQVPLGAQFLIPRVQAGYDVGTQRRDPARLPVAARILLRAHLGDLGPFDLGRQVTQLRRAGADPRLARHLGEHAHLGVQDGGWAAAHRLRPEVGELAQRGRVEGAGLHPVQRAAWAAQLVQPGPQLTGGTGGEGDREHVARVHHPGQHGVGDPVRDGPGLAGTAPASTQTGPRVASATCCCSGSRAASTDSAAGTPATEGTPAAEGPGPSGRVNGPVGSSDGSGTARTAYLLRPSSFPMPPTPARRTGHRTGSRGTGPRRRQSSAPGTTGHLACASGEAGAAPAC